MTFYLRRRTAVVLPFAAGSLAALAARPAAAAGPQHTATFAFANIGRDGNSATAISRVRNNVPGSIRFVGFAEIDEDDAPDEHALLDRYFQGWRASARDTHVPTRDSAQTPWAQTSSTATTIHPGIAGVSPARVLVVTRYQHRTSGRKLAHINTHFIAGAWNGKQDSYEALRKEYWWKMWDALNARIDNHVSSGYDVVASADFNRQGTFPELHWRERIAMVSATDRIYAIPAPDRKVIVEDTGSFPLGIDFHQGVWARLSFASR